MPWRNGAAPLSSTVVLASSVFLAVVSILAATAVAQDFPFAIINDLRVVNASAVLVHFNTPPDNGASAGPSTPSSGFAIVNSAQGCYFPYTPVLVSAQSFLPCSYSGPFVAMRAAAPAPTLFPWTLNSGSVVRIDEGMLLLSVATASWSTGGGGATYVLDDVFSSYTPRLLEATTTVERIGGSLIRVRGLSENASDRTQLRFFLLGGTSSVVEELIGAKDTDPSLLTNVSWVSRATLSTSPTCFAGQAAVVQPASQLPIVVFGCHLPGGPEFTGFLLISMTHADGPAVSTLVGNAASKTVAVVVRESYIFLVGNFNAQVVVMQAGTFSSDSAPDAASLIIGSVTMGFVSGICAPGPDNYGAAFIDPDTNSFFLGCADGVVAAPSILPSLVLSAVVLFPNPYRDAQEHNKPPIKVAVTYTGFNDTSLLMFSEFDDCTVFLPEGPFRLSSHANTTLHATLHKATQGQRLFVCVSLGYCPPQEPSADLCVSNTSALSCVMENGCIYTPTPPSPNSGGVTCCQRQHFPGLNDQSGSPPLGSYWMLAKASPIRLLTATPVQTLSKSENESESLTVTTTRATISKSVTPTRSSTTMRSASVGTDTQTVTETWTMSTTASASTSLSVNTSTLSKHTASASPTATRRSPSRTASVSHSASSSMRTVSRSRTNSLSANVSMTITSSNTVSVITSSPSSALSLTMSRRPVRTRSASFPTPTPTWTFSPSAELQQPHKNDWMLVVYIGAPAAAFVCLLAAVIVVLRRRYRSKIADGAARRRGLESGIYSHDDNVRQVNTYSPQSSVEIGGGAAALALGETTPINSAEFSGAPVYSALLNSSKYSISKLLGKGGYGMVFLATRNADGKKAALKYITCRTDYDRQLAVREFEVIMKVKHENMIQIWDFFLNWQAHVDFSAYGAGTTSSSKKGRVGAKDNTVGLPDGGGGAAVPGFLGDQAPFQQGDSATTALTRPRYVALVTKYYPEGDLKKYCYIEKKQGRQLPEERILSYMLQITTLIVKLHDQEQQVVHRDLKPENILLECQYRKVVVTDFGLAFNNINEQSHMTTQAGSLPFVAPECWSKYYTAKVDVWSLGCMLYALCTQRVTGDDSRVMFNDVDEPWFDDELRREVVVNAQYSNELFAIMMKLLVKNPLHRPSAYEAELLLAELMEARRYDMTYIIRTPEGRPAYAIERERAEETKRRNAEEVAAKEAAVRRAQREKRKLERHQLREQQQKQAAPTAPRE